MAPLTTWDGLAESFGFSNCWTAPGIAFGEMNWPVGNSSMLLGGAATARRVGMSMELVSNPILIPDSIRLRVFISYLQKTIRIEISAPELNLRDLFCYP
jgi:hypothetical protein